MSACMLNIPLKQRFLSSDHQGTAIGLDSVFLPAETWG